MSLVYEWRILRLKTKTDAQNRERSVCKVMWAKVGWDADGNHGGVEGHTSISSDDTGWFTSFDQLTEAQVIEWVKAEIDSDYEAQIDADIQTTINRLKRPAVNETTLPWT